jgi:hypothetical protein
LERTKTQNGVMSKKAAEDLAGEAEDDRSDTTNER